MSRSIRVASRHIPRVKQALKRSGFPSQHGLAMELGLSRPTVSKFLNGSPIDYLNFVEICLKLGLDWQEIVDLSTSDVKDVEDKPQRITHQHQDWGEAIDVEGFYGRLEERDTLVQWIVQDRCRLVAILGLGGIGKTTLSVKLALQIKDKFEYIIWRSLRNAPSVEDILAELIQFLFNEQEIDLSEDVGDILSLLIDFLKKHRCLLVLDNVEAILQGDHRAGYYREGYEGYGELLKRVGETPHQSCLVLTSREKPKEIVLLEGKARAVRSLQLTGLKEVEGKEFLRAEGLSESEEKWIEIIDFYAGNPLALKIVARVIQALFGGNIDDFLKQSPAAFGDIRELLEQQFNRLSDLEKEIMYWLAIEREPISLSELRENIVSPVSSAKIIEALDSLKGRAWIERSASLFTLQNVVIEYICDRLIEQVCEEIIRGKLALFNSHTLLMATAKDYVREAQTRLILKPVADNLLNALESEKSLVEQLIKILSKLQKEAPRKPGYVGGNTLNLLCQLQIDLTNKDFSNLTVWQAYLPSANLHNVNFAYSDLDKCVFAESLSNIYSLKFSPDGKTLATGDMEHKVNLWRVPNGTRQNTFEGHTSWVWSVDFSPDGQILVSGSDDRTVKLWDVRTGQCLLTLEGHKDRVRSVAFASDGKTLASGSDDWTVKLWNVRTGQCLQTLKGHEERVFSVAFASDGKTLASGSDDWTVKLWDVRTGQCLQPLKGHEERVWSVDFSPDGQILASGSDDRTVKLWDVRTGQCLQTLKGHEDGVRSVAFHPNGKTLVSGGDDKTIRLWDISTERNSKVLGRHDSKVLSVAFSPDGQIIASSSENKMLKLWDATKNQCFKTVQAHNNQVKSIAFSPDKQTLASGSEDRSIRLWKIDTEESPRVLNSTSWVWSVAFHPDGHLLASGGGDKTIRLWDVNTGQCLKVLQRHTSRVFSVAFSPDKQTLASGSEDKTIFLWEVSSGKCIKTLSGHDSWVWSVAFSPDSQILASGSYDRTVKLWNVKTGICIKTLEDHTNQVRSVTFSPDGQILASSSDDRTLRLWNVSTGECLRILEHGSRVWSVAFSPDRQTLASGSENQTLHLWNVSTGKCFNTIPVKANGVRSVAFSPDGQTLACISADEAISILDVKTGKFLRTFSNQKPYEGMDITGAKGLTEPQKTTLKELGAIEKHSLVM